MSCRLGTILRSDWSNSAKALFDPEALLFVAATYSGDGPGPPRVWSTRSAARRVDRSRPLVMTQTTCLGQCMQDTKVRGRGRGGACRDPRMVQTLRTLGTPWFPTSTDRANRILGSNRDTQSIDRPNQSNLSVDRPTRPNRLELIETTGANAGWSGNSGLTRSTGSDTPRSHA